LLPPDGQAVAIPSTADLPCANAIAGAQDKERQGIRCVRLTVESSGADAPQKLARDDLKLSQGGRAMQILFFEQEPASVGILIDTSGSMDTKLQQAKNAIAQFVNDLNSRDDIFLFAFSSKPFLLQPFTTNHRAVIQRTSLFYAQGETALYDTMVVGLLLLNHGQWSHKALFIITDGQDNASAWSKGAVLTRARQVNVAVYSIGIGNLPPQPPAWWRSRDAQSFVDMPTPSDFANATGGKAYNVRVAYYGVERYRAAALIAAGIGNRYDLGFAATDTRTSSIRLEVVNHPAAIVKVEGAPISIVNVAHAAS
jgi:Ca-activated chloride channel family protein